MVCLQSVHLGAKPLDTHDQYFFNWTLAFIVLMKHPLWRGDGSFTIANGPPQSSHSRVWILQDSWPYFTVSGLRLTQPGGPDPVFISLRIRVAQLYPQELGSLFVASYHSQGYGGGIRTRLYTGYVQRHCTHFHICESHWLHYCGNEINCCSVDHCWLLNTEQHRNPSDQ
jgi:hypothetical protein